jgi:hypothetical protein
LGNIVKSNNEQWIASDKIASEEAVWHAVEILGKKKPAQFAG